MPDKRLKPRQHDRRGIALDASCRDSDGVAREVELTNLSEGGCQIRLRDGRMWPNQVVAVRPHSLEAVSGVVRWSEDGIAGVEFARSLYPAVVDHLAKGNPSPAVARRPNDEAAFTDAFGRTLPPLGERRARSRG
ncbi:MAG TPA: PilZ domain-containing protein [Novosphingobium sp.]|nr:PilZ domain-containing protein [Novosphingobium sp.]